MHCEGVSLGCHSCCTTGVPAVPGGECWDDSTNDGHDGGSGPHDGWFCW